MRWFGIPQILLVAIAALVVVVIILERRPSEPVGSDSVIPDSSSTAGEVPRTAPAVAGSVQKPSVQKLPTSATERHYAPLGEGWLFTKGDAHLAKDPVSADPPWEAVSVPHSWNVTDGSDGGTYYRGIGWYRRWLPIPLEEEGRSVFVTFGAANMTATVYVNGEWAAQHDGGFATFTVDITPFVRFGTRNLIAVKVDNSDKQGIPPTYAEFTFSGGLYRPVTAITTSSLHLELVTHGWKGLHLHQRKVTAEVAELDAEIAVRNDTQNETDAQVVVSLRDATGATVVTAEAMVAVPARRTAPVTIPLRVERPHRWHGKADPYLYEVVVQVRSGGVVVDEVRQTTGLRSMRIDPQDGFFLNDQPYDLHGASLHQDRLGKGWLVSSEDRKEDVALLQELGATFVRLVHYQHDQETYELMDRAGIVVWAEIPVLMHVGQQPRFAESAKSQLSELIRQNAHHPSIVCWGLYNEIRSGPEDVALIRDLHALAKRLDPTRPTSAATYAVDTAEINHLTEVTSFNKYFGWFLPNIDAFGPWADQFHTKYPDRAVGITEYGAGGSIRQHEEAPTPPLPGLAKILPVSHSESYHTLFHETVWPQLAARKFLWCKAAWVLCDYTSDEAKTGDAQGYNDMGLVTGDRKIRKDAFYYYKAQWSHQPVLHITGRRFSKRQQVVEVKIFANVEHLKVTVNDRELPSKTAVGGVYRWEGVQLLIGKNSIKATGQSTAGLVSDEVVWHVER